MNCKNEVPSFDWEMTDFEHCHLKCPHCPDSKLLNVHFSLFFCNMCRTYLSHEERLNTSVSICELNYFQLLTSFALKYVMSYWLKFKLTGDWILPRTPLSEMSKNNSKRGKHIGRSHRSLLLMLGWWSGGTAEGGLLYLPIRNCSLHVESRHTKKWRGSKRKHKNDELWNSSNGQLSICIEACVNCTKSLLCVDFQCAVMKKK